MDATVVVPLDVGDVGVVENVRYGVDDELLHLGQSEVQNELVASESPRVLAGVQDPVGMLVVQGGVGVDHF